MYIILVSMPDSGEWESFGPFESIDSAKEWFSFIPNNSTIGFNIEPLNSPMDGYVKFPGFNADNK